jgi:hypothetical protein
MIIDWEEIKQRLCEHEPPREEHGQAEEIAQAFDFIELFQMIFGESTSVEDVKYALDRAAQLRDQAVAKAEQFKAERDELSRKLTEMMREGLP